MNVKLFNNAENLLNSILSVESDDYLHVEIIKSRSISSSRCPLSMNER